MAGIFERSFVVDTDCRNCVFAKYDGNTQVDCKLGRLDKFRENGMVVEEACDDELEYYVVKGVYCNTYRKAEWAERFKDKKLELHVLDEVKVKEKIYVYAGPDSTLEALRTTIFSLKAQTISPVLVEVMYNRSAAKSSHVLALLNKSKLKFRLTTITEPDADLWRSLDICHKKLDSVYYSIFQAGFEVPTDFIESLNKSLNLDMNRFVMLRPIDGNQNALTISTRLHKMLGSSTGKEPLVELTESLAQEQHLEHLIQEAAVICPNLVSRS